MTTTRVAGVMTGTSVDGIDVAVVDIDASTPEWLVDLRHAETTAFPDGLEDAIKAVLPPATSDVGTWCDLHARLGAAVGEVVGRIADHVDGVDLVVSHGQTVFHDVVDGRVRATLQIGQPAEVAERTGLPVISDLRARDVAAGGQGAPLVARFDELVLAGRDRAVAAVNLGGIANVTVVSADHPTVAFDSGPANVLSDLAVQRNGSPGSRFDRDGRLATGGTVLPELRGRLAADPYLAQPPPKTTGRERYNLAFLDAAVDGLGDLELPDLLATLVDVAAGSVARDLAAHHATRAWVSGGGVHNIALWNGLVSAAGTQGIDIRRCDDLGVPTDTKEAIAFAVLGLCSWGGCPGNVAGATGAAGPRVLGSLTPGAAGWGGPGPLATPRTLRMRGGRS